MNILGYILIGGVVFFSVLIILRRPKLNADAKRDLERYKYAILFFVVIAVLWTLSGTLVMWGGQQIPEFPQVPLNVTKNVTMMP